MKRQVPIIVVVTNVNPDAQTISLDPSESVELVCAMRSVPRILKGEN